MHLVKSFFPAYPISVTASYTRTSSTVFPSTTNGKNETRVRVSSVAPEGEPGVTKDTQLYGFKVFFRSQAIA